MDLMFSLDFRVRTLELYYYIEKAQISSPSLLFSWWKTGNVSRITFLHSVAPWKRRMSPSNFSEG